MSGGRSLNSPRHEYSIRTFLDGDEEDIIRLFDACYSELGGHCARTPDYWRWACLERPDVERKGITVVYDSTINSMAGYLVAGKSGNIWELGYRKQGDQKAIVQLLLEAALEYLRASGASEARLQTPVKDRVVKAASTKLGFSLTPQPDVHVSVLNFQRLISFLNVQANSEFKTMRALAKIRLSDAPSWMNPEVAIGNSNPEEKGEEATRFLVETDVSTLSRMLLGGASPFTLWLRGRVKVKPFWRIWTFARLVSAISLKEKWFIPLSDYG